MRQLTVIAFSLCMGVFLTVGAISDVEAKRLGGGKSFGSKAFQNQSAKKTSSAPNKTQQQNTAQKAAMAKKGGMMGMLGALMIGGLLGALFFGSGFENINFMDILIFGGIAFLLFKLLTRRKQASQPATANGVPFDHRQGDESLNQVNNQTRQSTNDYGNKSDDANAQEEPENILKTGKIPRGFDKKSFLTGAENVYSLLQDAWDNGELGDLRQFCTDEVFGEIQEQIQARTENSKTEIIALKSELVNVVISGNSTEATVVFNTELKENENNDLSSITHTQEAWYFVRPDNRQKYTWLLDGIQQIED